MQQVDSFYRTMYSAFWSENFWLSHNVTWSHFENHHDEYGRTLQGSIRHPMPRELLIAIPIALLMLVARHVVEKFIMKPIALLMGMKQCKSRTLYDIPELDQFYLKSKRPSHDQIKKLSVQLTMQERQIERWFRLKRNQSKSSVIAKFCEGGWKFIFHLLAFSFGLYVLHDEVFFHDTSLILDISTWPHHHIKAEFHAYYMVVLAYWMSMIMTLLSDVRRHDFHIMALHHVLTCALLVISWSTNFTRIGMLVLIAHDFADFFLEACKMMKHAKQEALSNIFFVFFFLSWSASRLYFYPRYIVYVCWSTYVQYYMETGGEHAYAALLLISFLTMLLVLHVIWTCIILRLLFELVFKKEWVDHRSDSEAEQSSDESKQNGINENGTMNGQAKKHQ